MTNDADSDSASAVLTSAAGRGAKPGSPSDALPAGLGLVLGIVACGVYYAGMMLARRDVGLDGDMLYVARFTQLAVYIAMAIAFRNHLPSVRVLGVTGCGCLLAAAALFSILPGVQGGAAVYEGVVGPSVLAVVPHVLSGTANGLFFLLFGHFFSTYGARSSAVAIAVAFVLREALFAWGAVWPERLVAFGWVWLRVLGTCLLFGALAAKARDANLPGEYAMQYGVGSGPAPADRPLAFLTNGSDWAFQLIAAMLLPAIFGFFSELFSTGGMSDGLHDLTSEVGCLAALLVFVGFMALFGERLTFMGLFVPAVVLHATGLLLLPPLWMAGADVFGIPLKCAQMLYETSLWILLARRAHEDPRRTYLYFGMVLAFSNVTPARFLAPLLLRGLPVDLTVVCAASVVFLWLLVMLCLLLFALQRGRSATCRRDAQAAEPIGAVGRLSGTAGGGASCETDAGDACCPAPTDPFAREAEALCVDVGLTPREREVMLEVLHGYTMPVVGKRLAISTETVRTHMRSVYQKAGVANKQALIALIDRRGHHA